MDKPCKSCVVMTLVVVADVVERKKKDVVDLIKEPQLAAVL